MHELWAELGLTGAEVGVGGGGGGGGGVMCLGHLPKVVLAQSTMGPCP